MLNVRFINFEVNSFNALATAHDFDAAEERFEVIQHTSGSLQETRQSVSSNPNVIESLLYLRGFRGKITADRWACARTD